MPKIKTNSDIDYYYSMDYPITPDYFELAKLIDGENPARKNYVATFEKLSRKPWLMDKLAGVALPITVLVGFFATAMVVSSILAPIIGPFAILAACGLNLAAGLLSLAAVLKHGSKIEKFWAKVSGHDKLHQLNLAEAKRLDTQLAPFFDAFKHREEQVKAAKRALELATQTPIVIQTPDGKFVAAGIEAQKTALPIATAATAVRPALTLTGPKKAGVKITSGPIQA